MNEDEILAAIGWKYATEEVHLRKSHVLTFGRKMLVEGRRLEREASNEDVIAIRPFASTLDQAAIVEMFAQRLLIRARAEQSPESPPHQRVWVGETYGQRSGYIDKDKPS